MITEDYVSFETAKLLKEKGFPQEYDKYHSMVYNEDDYEKEYEVQRMVLQTRLIKAGTLSSYPIGVPEPKCYCPTLQMAMKWLREVHEKYIEVCTDIDYDFKNIIFRSAVCDKSLGTLKEFDNCPTYEAACETAIKYILESLI